MGAVALKYPPTQNGLQKSLAADLNTGVTASLTLNNTTGIQNKPGVCVIDRIDALGNLKLTSVREYVAYTGTSGATLTGLTRNVDNSSSDQDHGVGAIVEFIPDCVWAQAILDALDGTASGLTLNAPVLTSPVLNTGVSGTAIDTDATLAANSDTKIASQKAVATRVRTPRIVSAASYTTDTGTSLNCDTTDEFIVTAQAGALKLNNPSGTPLNGGKLIVRIKDNGTPRALTYDTQFRAMGTALPTTTVTSKTLYMGFIFNSTDTKWDLVAAAQEA